MMIKEYPTIEFFIEKTLQTFESGYMGKEWDKILEEGRKVYGEKKNIFYDSFPPNLINLWYICFW